MRGADPQPVHGSLQVLNGIGAEMSAYNHAIILMQPTESRSSRTFSDFENLNTALEALVGVYEGRLRAESGPDAELKYTVEDLASFLMSIYDLSMLLSVSDWFSYAQSFCFVTSRQSRSLRCDVSAGGQAVDRR